MNEFVRIAQASTISTTQGEGSAPAAPSALRLEGPAADQSIVLERQAGQEVDFRQILDDDISFFRIESDLQMIFSDGGSVVVKGFFDGNAEAPVAIVGPEQTLSLEGFEDVANLQTADDLQTAAGPTSNLGAALGGAQSSGQNFQAADIGGLGDGLGITDLLQGEPPLDNSFLIEDVFSGDLDGEVDTVPVIGTPVDSTLDEANTPGGTDPDAPVTVTASLAVDFGANPGTSPRLEFASLPTGLTSDGVPLVLTVTTNPDGGQTLVAAKDDGSGETVFTVTLEITGSGSGASAQYTVELLGNLDHDGEGAGDSLPLTFGFTAFDSDGDSASSAFTINITDDAPLTGEAENSLLEESDLATGTAPDGTSLTKSGSLGLTWGADDGDAAVDVDGQDAPGGTGNRSVVFAAVADQPTQPTTSFGEALEYVLSQDGTVLTAYAGAGRGDGDKVFVVTLSDDGDGAYTFELLGAIDHAAPGSEDQSTVWDLDFTVLASDGDGDAVESGFRVSIGDDAPQTGCAENGTVQETALADDASADAGSRIASGALNVVWGADQGDAAADGAVQDTPGGTGNRSITFAAPADQPVAGLTSGGVALEYVLSSGDTVLTAYRGAGRSEADKVFEVTLSDDGTGSYTFELLAGLDHDSPGSCGASDDLPLTFNFVASDSDGDETSASFQVTVEDGGPLVGDSDRGIVEEEDLPGGLDDPYPVALDGASNQAGTPLTDRVSGALGIDWRADAFDTGADTVVDDLPVQDAASSAGQRAVVFSGQPDGLVVDPDSLLSIKDGNGDSFDLSSLTSRGEALSYVLSNDGTMLTAYAQYGSGNERSVFRVALSDEDTGAFRFILDDTLDHPIKDTTPFDEDALSLSFNFTARDSDGDTATGAFEVLVLDDGPLFRTSDVHALDSLEPVVTTETADLRIPAVGTSGTISSTINIAAPGTIFDLNVSIALQHSFIGDLEVFLIAPDGTQIALMLSDFSRTGAVDGTVSFDDDASTSIADAGSSIVGTWKPAGNLNLDFLEGRDQTGAWTLEITDSFGGDSGQLESWTLEIQSGVSAVVDEDDLSAGLGDSAPGDNATITNETLDGDEDPTTVYGDLGVLWGADDENSVENGGRTAGTGDRAVTFVEGAGGTIDSLLALGLTSNGEALSYSLNSAGDVLTATACGRVIFTVELFDTDSGSFKFDLQEVLDHAEGDAENDLILTFLFSATDSDGDTGTSSFSVAVDDDMPALGEGVERVVLDEDDIFGLFSQGTAPWDGDSDGSTTGASDLFGPAFASGSLGTVAGTGADGAGPDAGFAFTAAAAADMEALGLQSQGAALSFTVVALSGRSFLVGYVDDGNGAFDLPDRPVISLELDADGNYAVRLHDQLDHLAGDGENSALLAGTGSLSEIDLGSVIEVTDGDGDSASLTGRFQVTITDDVPVVELCVKDHVRIDETYGLHSDNVFDPSTGTYDPEVVELFAGVTAPGSDPDLPGPVYAQSAMIGVNGLGGTDDPASSDLSLRIDDTSSGLFTTEGQAITLSLEGDLVVGRVAGTGEAAFALHLDDNGDMSVVQYLSLSHPDTSSSDEHISLDGKLSVVLTVTDADGDTVTKEAPVGADVTFDDDGPSAVRRGSGLQFTESGSSPAVAHGALQFDGGADGASVTDVSFISIGSYVRAIDPDATGADRRGPLTVDGTPVTWASSTDANGVITLTGVLEGTETKAFEMVVNPDGTYTFEQFRGFDHADIGETGRQDSLRLHLRFTVTDGDGDTDSARAVIRINDSGPSVSPVDDQLVAEDGLLALDDIPLGIDWGADDGNDNDGLPGDRSVSFASNAAADAVSVADPNGALGALSSQGMPVNYAFVDGVLVGYTGDCAPCGFDDAAIVFTVSLSDEGAGSYDFELRRPLDHTAPVGTDHYLDLTFAFNAVDSDGDASADGTFTVRVDAAGSASPMDYSNLSSGVFVNLSNENQMVLGQTVAAETATDRTGAVPPVIGNDSVSGQQDATGGAGDDILVGSDAANTLTGNGGADLLIGGEGDDRIIGGDGDDTAEWSVGDGRDQVSGAASGGTGAGETDTFRVNGSADSETFFVETVADYLARVGAAVETLAAGTEIVVSRSAWGGPSSVIAELDTIDKIDINGLGGADALIVSGDFSATDLDLNAITFTGGEQDDIADTTSRTSAHQVVIKGNGGNDWLLSAIGYNTFEGGSGVDTVDYSAASRSVYVRLDQNWATALSNKSLGWIALNQGIADGSVTHDDLIGVENVIGTQFNDLITANAADNTIWGGDGKDFLSGLGGDDAIYGEEGNDRLSGGTGFNLLDGGTGHDRADYSGSSEGIYVRMDLGWTTALSNKSLGWGALTSGIARDLIEHDDLVSIEEIQGSRFNDIITGNSGDNTLLGEGGNDLLNGGAGADTLVGGAGEDELFGGSGNDKLVGGADKDTLTGGANADTFVFGAGEGSSTLSGADRVTDFKDGTDKLVITGGLTFADLTVTDDGAGNAVIYDTVNNQYVAVLEGVPASDIDASDFGFTADPVVLDLDGDGVELLSASEGVAFDHNGDGTAETAGWVGADDGLLAVDLDGSGAIEDGTELFSEVFNGGSYADSLEALASFDSNTDGILDARDDRFADIKVWQDANSDGVSQPGELSSLTERGIAAIDLETGPVYGTLNGNTVTAEGTFTRTDGTTGSYAGTNFALADDASADSEDVMRQSAAMAAGVALVIYTASTQEVAAGLTAITVTKAPAQGVIDVSEDLTVTFVSEDAPQASETVTFDLVFADGSSVSRSVELEMLSQETAQDGSASAAQDAASTETVPEEAGAQSETADTSLSGDGQLRVVVTASEITGDDGDNVLVGTQGDDVLIGGLGADTLTGGDGADTFVLTSLAEADLITDYSLADGDKIDLGALLDGAFGPQDAAEDFVRVQKGPDGAIHLQVDMDGAGGEFDWQEAAVLQDHASMGDTVRVVLDQDGQEAQVPVTAVA